MLYMELIAHGVISTINGGSNIVNNRISLSEMRIMEQCTMFMSCRISAVPVPNFPRIPSTCDPLFTTIQNTETLQIEICYDR